MKTVLDEPISEWLTANGHFYAMHRFDIDNVAYAKRMHDKRELSEGAEGQVSILLV